MGKAKPLKRRGTEGAEELGIARIAKIAKIAEIDKAKVSPLMNADTTD